MPATVAPRRAMASARMPPPHPTSSTRLPASAAWRSIQSRRKGLMSCSGRNSPCGSHQRCASWLNFSSSAGSAFTRSLSQKKAPPKRGFLSRGSALLVGRARLARRRAARAAWAAGARRTIPGRAARAGRPGAAGAGGPRRIIPGRAARAGRVDRTARAAGTRAGRAGCAGGPGGGGRAAGGLLAAAEQFRIDATIGLQAGNQLLVLVALRSHALALVSGHGLALTLASDLQPAAVDPF